MNLQEMTDNRVWRTFSINVSLVILLFILGIFIGLFVNNKRLIESELKLRARSHFNNIVLTRRWNAEYGGVFVEKTEGVHSNPYLENPDIESVDGKVYTKKNPALMTREISELAEEAGDYTFHITSLKPLNPNNKANAMEQAALSSFENGVMKEAFDKIKGGERIYYWYMAPLFVEESCLACHAKQGYKVGDVRGGISVKFDMTDVQHALNINRIILICLFLTTIGVLLGIIYVLINKLMRHLTAIQQRIADMAVTDELTGLYNRRYFYDQMASEFSRSKRHGHPLSFLLIDVDHFKVINDTYGHHVGDLVLRRLGNILSQSCRMADTVARYGGEEFVHMLPDTDEEGARLFAEKQRELVDGLEILSEVGKKLRITISVGVASCTGEQLQSTNSPDQILTRADKALYRAKAEGRNRVKIG